MNKAILALLVLLSSPARAANPTMSDDFRSIIQWLTKQTAQGLGFNGGSSFDPPNEMRPWRAQPDISLGVGMLPFDKSSFPEIQVEALAEKDPEKSLPDKMMFPNLTVHSRLGLPWRMDLGGRFANMTTPKNYKLSDETTGNGQSNTVGISLRKHFCGGREPLVSVSANYQRTFGYFNFASKFDNVELTPGFLASSVNSGQLEWDVRSLGVNAVLSQAFGKWTPFIGAGYNRMFGEVRGRLSAVWQTPLIATSVGEATDTPEPSNTRMILGFQRMGPLFQFFMNGEVKTSGTLSGKTFIVSTGFAAPFRIGANNALVRYGRNKPAGLAFGKKYRRANNVDKPEEVRVRSHKKTRVNSYWLWGRDKAPKTAREDMDLKGALDDDFIYIR